MTPGRRPSPRCCGIELGLGISVVTTPTLPRQSADGAVDGDLDLQVESRAPALQFLAEEDVLRGPGAVQQHDLPYFVAVREQVVERRAQRRQADAAGDDHDVVPSASSTGQRRAEGTAHAERRRPASVRAWPW